MSEGQKPSIGRIVHVYDEDRKHASINGVGPYPAIITFVHPDGSINASGFPHYIISDMEHLPFSPDGQKVGDVPIWWRWPERV